jgi:hypothetical protein
MNIKNKIVEIGISLSELLQLEKPTTEEIKLIDELVNAFTSIMTRYKPTLKNLSRALNYLIPSRDVETIKDIVEKIKSNKNISHEWMKVVSKDTINNNTDINESNEFDNINFEKSQENRKANEHFNFIKPNRKMAVCKPSCKIDDWLEYITAFDEDARIMSLSDSEKLNIFWRQLGDSSEERIYYEYVLSQNPSMHYEDVIKQITNLKIGTDNDDYWDEAIEMMEPQKQEETVSSFAARFINLMKFYKQFTGNYPPLRYFRNKLRYDIKDVLVGAVGIQKFDDLLNRALIVERDMKTKRSMNKKPISDAKLLNLNSILKCQLCDKVGHSAKECFRVVPCGICHKTGHNPKFCKLKYPGQRKTHYRPVENAKEEANHILNVCNSSREKLIVDSGATIHTCNNISLLSEVEECNREAVNASGQFIKFTMKGNMKVMLQNGESLKISDVYYSPHVTMNLISVSQIHRRGGRVDFNECVIFGKKEQLITRLVLENGLYLIPTKEQEVTASLVSSKIWHQRLGHLAYSSIQNMKRNGLIDFDERDESDTCIICPKGKLTRNPFKYSNNKKEIGQVIVTDVVSFGEESFGGSKYAVTFTDHASDFVRGFTLKRKSEVFEYLKVFIRWFERKSGTTIKAIRSDNGGEYLNENILEYLIDLGISLQLTIPYSPSQNGKAEVLNRHLTEMLRSLLKTAYLPNGFWAEAFMHAIYIKNRTIRSGKEISPIQECFKIEESLENTKVFGCHAEYWIPNEKREKLDEKSNTSIYLGTQDSCTVSELNITRRGYRLYDLKLMKVVYARDVKFYEHIFPYQSETVALNFDYKNVNINDEKNYWKAAIEKEIDAHKKNNTWEVVMEPEGEKLVDTRWVLTIKYKADGS